MSFICSSYKRVRFVLNSYIINRNTQEEDKAQVADGRDQAR